MSLTKETSADKIEVVTGQDGEGNTVTSVQVRTATKIIEDGEVISSTYHRHVINQGDDYSSEPDNVQAVCAAVFAQGIIMLTIDDKTYTEEDLNEAQIALVKRITALNNDLYEMNMRTQELNVLISAYTNSIKESFTEEE